MGEKFNFGPMAESGGSERKRKERREKMEQLGPIFEDSREIVWSQGPLEKAALIVEIEDANGRRIERGMAVEDYTDDGNPLVFDINDVDDEGNPKHLMELFWEDIIDAKIETQK